MKLLDCTFEKICALLAAIFASQISFIRDGANWVVVKLANLYIQKFWG